MVKVRIIFDMQAIYCILIQYIYAHGGVCASPFLEALKRDIRLRGCSIRTEKTYLYYIRCYIHFIGKRHPDQAGASEIKAFLSHLACDRGAFCLR